VPQIDTPLLLDVLLGLVILLFVPFGIRHGVAKEAVVSAGILLGATLAERFGPVWGGELSVRFGLERGVAVFAAQAATLFAATLLLGYGGGAALGPIRAGTLSRLAGGLLAACNAGLLLSYLLGWIDSLLGQGSALDDGVLSRALLRQADVLLLAAVGVLLVLIVVGWVVNASRARSQPRAYDGSTVAGMPPRQRPVRLASAADAGKYEPDLEPVARSGRFGPSLDATSPLPSGGDYSGQGPWSADNHATPGSNGHSRSSAANGAWQRPGSPVQHDATVWAAWSTGVADEGSPRDESAGQWPVSSQVGVTDDERCAVCRARVGPRDVFCPECGATLSRQPLANAGESRTICPAGATRGERWRRASAPDAEGVRT
jgi:uncharacterized membrane protein required for colicin V production